MNQNCENITIKMPVTNSEKKTKSSFQYLLNINPAQGFIRFISHRENRNTAPSYCNFPKSKNQNIQETKIFEELNTE